MSHKITPERNSYPNLSPGLGICRTCGRWIVYSSGNDKWYHDGGKPTQADLDFIWTIPKGKS